MKQKSALSLILGTLIACIFSLSCNKEKKEPSLTLNTSTLISHRGDYFFFEIKKGNEIISPMEFKWSLDNEYIGAATQHGLFFAERVGTGKITATRNGETLVADVTVEPVFNFLTTDLIIDFNFSFDVIKGLEKREFISEITSEQLTYKQLIYKGDTDKINSIIYLFNKTESSDRLYSVTVEYSDEIPLDDLLFYYSELYYFLGGNSGVHQFSPVDYRYMVHLHRETKTASYRKSPI